MLLPAFVYPISVSSTNQLQYLLCVLFSILHIIVVFSIILKLSFQKSVFILSFINSTVTFGLINTYVASYYSVSCVSSKFKVLIYAFLLPAFVTHVQSWYFSHNTLLGLLFFCIFIMQCVHFKCIFDVKESSPTSRHLVAIHIHVLA